MNDTIARLDLIAVSADGVRIPAVLSVGRPYQNGADPLSWSCGVSFEPLFPDMAPLIGNDSFQALWLATRHALTLLASVRRSGDVQYPDGTSFPFDAF